MTAGVVLDPLAGFDQRAVADEAIVARDRFELVPGDAPVELTRLNSARAAWARGVPIDAAGPVSAATWPM
jgi:hypothetical protein